MTVLANKRALTGMCLGLAAAAVQLPVLASTSYTLQDTYTGGIDPYAFQGGTNPSFSTMDSVGGGVFNISSANVSLGTGSQLSITINTAYAGVPGTSAAQGTNYGDLLLGNTWTPTSGATASQLATNWNSVLPSGYQVTSSNTYVQDSVSKDNSTNGYLGDVYSATDQKNKEWGYSVNMVGSSTTNSKGQIVGTVALYQVINASTTLDAKGGGMVLSSGGCGSGATTHGIDNNCNAYYRAGEAVQYIPDSGQQAVATGTYTIDPHAGTITYTFSEANTNLGDNFAVSWAMTCANDIIQGMVHLPEPGTWAMLAFGMAGLGGLRWRARRTR